MFYEAINKEYINVQSTPLRHRKVSNRHILHCHDYIADITHFTFNATENYADGDTFECDCGKNILEVTATSQTICGVTITVNADKSITFDGTSSTSFTWDINSSMQDLTMGTYTMSSTNPMKAGSVLILKKEDRDIAVVPETGTSKTFTVDEPIDSARCYLYIGNGVVFNNVTIFPQVERGSIATSYEPYEGIIYKAIFYKDNDNTKQTIFKNGDKVDVYVNRIKKEILFYDAYYKSETTMYKALLPPIFQDVEEINALDNTIRVQLEKLNALIKDGVDNNSIAHATEKGIERWEKILGVSSPMNSTLQARKDALKSKLIAKPPINLKTLKAIIEAYMGLQVDITVKDYQITVKYRGTSRIADLKPLYATVYETIPASMLLEIMYAYITWNEIDTQNLTWDMLDAKNLTWSEFEKGEWIT